MVFGLGFWRAQGFQALDGLWIKKQLRSRQAGAIELIFKHDYSDLHQGACSTCGRATGHMPMRSLSKSRKKRCSQCSGLHVQWQQHRPRQTCLRLPDGPCTTIPQLPMSTRSTRSKPSQAVASAMSAPAHTSSEIACPVSSMTGNTCLTASEPAGFVCGCRNTFCHVCRDDEPYASIPCSSHLK